MVLGSRIRLAQCTPCRLVALLHAPSMEGMRRIFEVLGDGSFRGPASGSGECSLVAGIDGAEEEWRDSSQRD